MTEVEQPTNCNRIHEAYIITALVTTTIKPQDYSRGFIVVYIVIRLLRYFLCKIEDILSVCLHTLIFFLGAYYNLIPLTETRTGWYKMTTDNIFFHALETVYLATYGSLVENLCGFLE